MQEYCQCNKKCIVYNSNIQGFTGLYCQNIATKPDMITKLNEKLKRFFISAQICNLRTIMFSKIQ